MALQIINATYATGMSPFMILNWIPSGYHHHYLNSYKSYYPFQFRSGQFPPADPPDIFHL